MRTFLWEFFFPAGWTPPALVALASRLQSDLRTFTVIFPEQRYSEAKISRETAKHFKTRHQEVLLTPDSLVAQLDDAVKSLDQPTMDGLNTYFVSRAARKAGLKVALSGLGSDEIFGGYSTFVIDSSRGVCRRAGPLDSRSIPPLDGRRGREDRLWRCGSQGCRGVALSQGFSARLLFHAAVVHPFPRAALARSVF